MASKEPKQGWWANWQAQQNEEPLEERLIEAKLHGLERQVRLHRYLFGLVGLIFAGGAVWYLNLPPEPVREVLRVHRLEVLSPQGREGVVLEVDRQGGRISLRYSGRDGEPPPPAVFLSAEATGGALQLFEPGQNFYALSLGVGRAGQGVAQVRTRGRQQGVELSGPATPTSGGTLTVYNADGKPAVALGADGAGRGIVSTQGGG